MPQAGDSYEVFIRPSHLDWGMYRNPTNRDFTPGESYIKIPARYARMYDLQRGTQYTAHFANGYPNMLVQAAGNGPYENGIQYSKQFHGVGRGACRALTPWYVACNAAVGDIVRVEFLSPTDVLFTKL